MMVSAMLVDWTRTQAIDMLPLLSVIQDLVDDISRLSTSLHVSDGIGGGNPMAID
jgi:hypothetical protein